MVSYRYAKEKLYDAVRALVMDKDDIRYRLIGAYHCFHPLRPKDLPKEMREDYVWVSHKVRALSVYLNRHGNLWVFKKKTFIPVAEKIWQMYEKIELHN